MRYDGKGKLSEAIAELYGFSLKNHVRIAKLIKDAKTGLGITSRTKLMPDDMKLTIYRWHYDRLNPVQNIKQNLPIQIDDEKPVLLPDDAVCDVKQDRPIQDDDTIDNTVYDFKQIHFAITLTHAGKIRRTTVMLEGYLVKALQCKHGLIDNTAIRAWIEDAIKSDSRFDHDAPLTRQVKRVVVESFV